MSRNGEQEGQKSQSQSLDFGFHCFPFDWCSRCRVRLTNQRHPPPQPQATTQYNAAESNGSAAPSRDRLQRLKVHLSQKAPLWMNVLVHSLAFTSAIWIICRNIEMPNHLIICDTSQC